MNIGGCIKREQRQCCAAPLPGLNLTTTIITRTRMVVGSQRWLKEYERISDKLKNRQFALSGRSRFSSLLGTFVIMN